MSVREAVDTTSKAFATGGEDFAYYLSESRAMQGLTAPAHRGHAPTAAPCTTITAALLSPRCMQVAASMKKLPGTCFVLKGRFWGGLGQIS